MCYNLNIYLLTIYEFESIILRISFLGISTGIIFGAFGTHALKEFFSNYGVRYMGKRNFLSINKQFWINGLVLLNKSNFIKNPPFYY